MSTKILIAYVHDRPGVLTKIASIFYRRGLNIRTLTVGGTSTHEVSKIVLRVAGSPQQLNRLMLSVDNLIDVISIDIKEDSAQTARELCLARVIVGENHSHAALREALRGFDTRVWQHDDHTLVLEMVDSPQRIDAFIAILSEFDLVDLSRTGATAIPGRASAPDDFQFDPERVTTQLARLHPPA